MSTSENLVKWHCDGDFLGFGVESSDLLKLAVIGSTDRYLELMIPAFQDWNITTKVYLDMGFAHWSRKWEYPWVIRQGKFERHHKVLDVGGCMSILPYRMVELCDDVTVLDPDKESWERFSQTITHKLRCRNSRYSLRYEEGVASKIPYSDESFDRVMCISVLEHTPDPIEGVKEMLRVLAPGGKLILTIDVADRVRHNHTIDLNAIDDIAKIMGVEVPPKPSNVCRVRLDELPPLEPGEPNQVELNVIGMCYCKSV